MSLVDDLKATREWLDEPKHWCKRAFGKIRNEKGNLCATRDQLDVAEKTCLIGAYQKVTGKKGYEDFVDALGGCLPDEISRFDVFGFNDAKVFGFNDAKDTKHADILRVLDCAISKAEEVRA